MRTAALVAAMLLSLAARADEGMWMIQDINEALEKNMKARGLKLSAKEIYNADAPGSTLSDAVVSLGFYCTGSIISDRGLVITNHHCAYSNVARLSTPEHNYLEDGFWAMTPDQELPVEGEKFYFLKSVLDVTDEVAALKKQLEARGEEAGTMKVSSILQKRYEESSGLTCILSSMWAGEKYYMSVYKVYTDVRLVAVPPLCIGFFGGETDNWTWPRHNCDFAMYRIYDNGVPLVTDKYLKVSLKGYTPGSFSMVIGYPG
ncbi:MAG: S46 family peptidase, partial [Bacteroidales bacterium]|nr:S46 family peptidase [Bacteroidales bacterium]